MRREVDIIPAPGTHGCLGSQIVGEKISLNKRNLSVTNLLGEGGFSYVYLVEQSSSSSKSSVPDPKKEKMVLKIANIQNREQKEIAEKEATLLRRLNHPSIIKMIDCCYQRNSSSKSSDGGGGGLLSSVVGGGHHSSDTSKRAQYLILMEYCENGHVLDVIQKMESIPATLSGSGSNEKIKKQRFTLPSLIMTFGQICNAVSYLHAQNPPIVHRDLKLSNFLVTDNGRTYKLCDFGSAVFGHVHINSARERSEAEEVIQKTTTQMFRAPEMVDLYMSNVLTESTDVWALGCCLYSMAFFQNCFEEGSNLAILSKNYKIPQSNPYGEGLADLIDRMITIDFEERANMTEVIMCLSALYSKKALPPRRKKEQNKTPEQGSNPSDKNPNNNVSDYDNKQSHPSNSESTIHSSRAHTSSTASRTSDDDNASHTRGYFRTNGQGIISKPSTPKKPLEAKKLNPNSAAARRKAHRNQSQSSNDGFSNLPTPALSANNPSNTNDTDFPTSSSSSRNDSIANKFEESFDSNYFSSSNTSSLENGGLSSSLASSQHNGDTFFRTMDADPSGGDKSFFPESTENPFPSLEQIKKQSSKKHLKGKGAWSTKALRFLKCFPDATPQEPRTTNLSQPQQNNAKQPLDQSEQGKPLLMSSFHSTEPIDDTFEDFQVFPAAIEETKSQQVPVPVNDPNDFDEFGFQKTSPDFPGVNTDRGGYQC